MTMNELYCVFRADELHAENRGADNTGFESGGVIPLAQGLPLKIFKKMILLVTGLISLYNKPYKGQEQGKVKEHRYSGSNT